jgi:nicotinamidase-related amidase
MAGTQNIPPIDVKKNALILIEFQREWLDEDGKINKLMEDKQQFQAAIEGAKQAVSAARRHGMPVVHVGLRFQKGYPELGKGVCMASGLLYQKLDRFQLMEKAANL